MQRGKVGQAEVPDREGPEDAADEPPDRPLDRLAGGDARQEPPPADGVPDEEGEAVGEDEDPEEEDHPPRPLPDRVEEPQRGDRPAEGAEVDRAEEGGRRRGDRLEVGPSPQREGQEQQRAERGKRDAQPARRDDVEEEGGGQREADERHGADAPRAQERGELAQAHRERQGHDRHREPGRAEEERREERRQGHERGRHPPGEVRLEARGAQPARRQAVRPGRFRRSAAHASGIPRWPGGGAGAGSRATAPR